MFYFLKKLISLHFYELFDYLDPIESDRRITKRKLSQNTKWSHKFVFPAFLVIFTILHSCVYMVYEGHDHWNIDTMLHSQYIFWRQIFPRQLWQCSVPVCLIGTISPVVNFLWLIFHSYSDTNRYHLISYGKAENDNKYLSICERVLSKHESATILKYHRKIKLVVLKLLLGFHVAAVIYFWINVYINDLYQFNFSNILMWLILLPFTAYYQIYG